MVVEGDGKRVALQCDGDKWHTEENLAEDMARQAILERLGWRFIRIRGSEFFRDPEAAMLKVFDRLTYFDVLPQAIESEGDSLETEGDDLKARVIRRAERIRRMWNGEEQATDHEAVLPAGVRQDEVLVLENTTQDHPLENPAEVENSVKQFQSVMLIDKGELSCPYDDTTLKIVDAELAKYSNAKKTLVSEYIPVQLLYCPNCQRAYTNNSLDSNFIRLAGKNI